MMKIEPHPIDTIKKSAERIALKLYSNRKHRKVFINGFLSGIEMVRKMKHKKDGEQR